MFWYAQVGVALPLFVVFWVVVARFFGGDEGHPMSEDSAGS